MHRAFPCDAVGEAERLERRAGAHHRGRPIVPATAEVLGHHVDGIGDDEREPRQLTGLDGGGDRVHHLDVLVQHVETGLARFRVVPRRDDENVLPLDLVESTTANLDLREERACVHEVERKAARGAGIPAVDGDPPGEPAHDQCGGRRHAHSARANDPDRQPRHVAAPNSRYRLERGTLGVIPAPTPSTPARTRLATRRRVRRASRRSSRPEA